MKRILKLTFNEIKHLKWTVLVTALALTLFTASLFAVIFVYADLSGNVFNYFDGEGDDMSFYAKSASAKDVTNELQSGLFVGEADGITRSAVLTAYGGNSVSTETEVVKGDGSVYYESLYCRAVVVTQFYLDAYRKAFDVVSLPKKSGEILLADTIAEKLQVNVDDEITIGERNFTVCGVYDKKLFSSLLDYDYLVSVDENTVFSEVNVSFNKSENMYNAYLTLQKNGVEAELSGFAQAMMDNLSLVNGFLIAIALTIATVNILILYAVFAVILRNRQSYVCRLKIAGAGNGLIFAVYFTIIIVLLALICVAGFFLSKLMVNSIMDACTQAFESPFTAHTDFGVCAVYFAAVGVLLVLLCFFIVRKIDNKAIVSVTRSD